MLDISNILQQARQPKPFLGRRPNTRLERKVARRAQRESGQDPKLSERAEHVSFWILAIDEVVLGFSFSRNDFFVTFFIIRKKVKKQFHHRKKV